jgi:hypothetical protein
MILLSPFGIPKGRGFIREVGREGSTRRFVKENKKAGTQRILFNTFFTIPA